MHPILFTLPGLNLPIYSYGAMLGISFVIGFFYAPKLSERLGQNPDVHLYGIMVAMLTNLIGARLFFILANLDQPWTLARMMDISAGGLVAYGGYLFGVGGSLLFFHLKKANLWRYMDSTAPFLALGLALVRIGCFLNGCCFGKPTDGPTGVAFPPTAMAYKQYLRDGLIHVGDAATPALHPTQLYESFVGFCLVALLLWLHFRRERSLKAGQAEGIIPRDGDGKDGRIFWLFVIFYSVWRFFVEFIRDDEGRGTVLSIFTQSQFTGLVLIGLPLFMIYVYLPRHPYKAPVVEEAPRLAAKKAKSKKRR